MPSLDTGPEGDVGLRFLDFLLIGAGQGIQTLESVITALEFVVERKCELTYGSVVLGIALLRKSGFDQHCELG